MKFKTCLAVISLSLIILLTGCSQETLIERLESGKTLKISGSSVATYNTPSLSNEFIFWADTREGINKTCTKRTCNYNVYKLNLKTGEEIAITNSKWSELEVITDGKRLIWSEKHPAVCINESDRSTCEYDDKILLSTIDNLEDRKVIYETSGNYPIIWKDIQGDWIVIERNDRKNFNDLQLISIETGDVTEIPAKKSKPKKGKYSAESEPFISKHGRVWFTSWYYFADEFIREAFSYNIETKKMQKLMPPGGFGEKGPIQMSRTEEGVVWVQGSKALWEVWHYKEEEEIYEKIYETERFLRNPILKNKMLLFKIKETGYDEIYAINTDTKEETQITNNKDLILNLFYEKPYLVWTTFSGGLGIKFKKLK